MNESNNQPTNYMFTLFTNLVIILADKTHHPMHRNSSLRETS